jgi:hypothetical protein
MMAIQTRGNSQYVPLLTIFDLYGPGHDIVFSVFLQALLLCLLQLHCSLYKEIAYPQNTHVIEM